jgi:arsenite methyltransferase
MRSQGLSEQEAATMREAVKEKYRAVSKQPADRFAYPVGRDSALSLGYEPGLIESISPEVVERFVGVGNPFTQRQPCQGERVLDAGCGAGLDTFVASALVGSRGFAVGVDLTPEMLDVARRGLADWPLENVQFREASVEDLPFEDEAFDLVFSNGALNLVPDKDAAFRELRRVLRPGGHFVAVDLLIDDAIPEEVLAGKDAWSN